MALIRDAVVADTELLVDFVIAEAREAEGRALDRESTRAAVAAALANPALARYWIAELETQLRFLYCLTNGTTIAVSNDASSVCSPTTSA
jgi:hypothetical protein